MTLHCMRLAQIEKRTSPLRSPQVCWHSCFAVTLVAPSPSRRSVSPPKTPPSYGLPHRWTHRRITRLRGRSPPPWVLSTSSRRVALFHWFLIGQLISFSGIYRNMQMSVHAIGCVGFGP